MGRLYIYCKSTVALEARTFYIRAVTLPCQRAPRLGRPRKASTSTLIVRDRALVLLIDGWLDRLAATGSPGWTRTGLLRAVVRRAVRDYGARGETP